MDQSTIAKMRPVSMTTVQLNCRACRSSEFKAHTQTMQLQTIEVFKVISGFMTHVCLLCDTFGSTGEIICSNPTKNKANL